MDKANTIVLCVYFIYLKYSFIWLHQVSVVDKANTVYNQVLVVDKVNTVYSQVLVVA